MFCNYFSALNLFLWKKGKKKFRFKVRWGNGTERKTTGEYRSTLYASLVDDNIQRLSIVAIDDDQETGDMNGWNEDLKNKTETSYTYSSSVTCSLAAFSHYPFLFCANSLRNKLINM